MRRNSRSAIGFAIALSAGMLTACSSSLPSAQPETETLGFTAPFNKPAASNEKYVKIPAKDSIQTDLISTFPKGIFKPKLGWESFSIPSRPDTCGYAKAGACNFYDGFGFSGSGTSITMKTEVAKPVDAYTLMNAYSPPSGTQIATIEFEGSGGATVTFALVGGKDIRDFYNGGYADSLSNGITGVVARNVFKCVDPTTCLGAGGSGDVHTGDTGDYRVDEQQYSLKGLKGQTLTKIVLTDTNDGSQPILLGLTIESESKTP
jgi:hypothetical protein